MMRVKTVLILLTAVCISNGNIIAQYDSILFNTAYRTYLLHLPADYNETHAFPMVIAMHGGMGNAYNMENQSGLSDKADADSFIVVYPEGLKGGLLNMRTWNAGWCCGFSSYSNVDDVGFISALLDSLIASYSIDTKRIYATGMSNGGFMSYRLACELSQRIAAIAPVAASMSLHECSPDRPVPILHFHSYLDTNVPYEGGIGTSGPSDHYNPPADSVHNSWASVDNCEISNDTIIDNEQYTLVKWTSCDCGSEIHFYITHDGGHSWPGGNATPTGDPVSVFLNASEIMWNFLRQYSLDCNDATDGEETCDLSNVNIYPNPTKGVVYFSESNLKIFDVSVYNAMGSTVIAEKGISSIDLRNKPDGVYLISLRINNQVITIKVVKAE
jgi:polyhydroxybutyrate depolymerase